MMDEKKGPLATGLGLDRNAGVQRPAGAQSSSADSASQSPSIATSEYEREARRWRQVEKDLSKAAARTLRTVKGNNITMNARRLLDALIEASAERRTVFPEFPDIETVCALSGFPRQKFYPASDWLNEAGIADWERTATGWVRFGFNIDADKWLVVFSRSNAEHDILTRGVRDGTDPSQPEVLKLSSEEDRRFNDAMRQQARDDVLRRIESKADLSRVVTTPAAPRVGAQLQLSRVVTPAAAAAVPSSVKADIALQPVSRLVTREDRSVSISILTEGRSIPPREELERRLYARVGEEERDGSSADAWEKLLDEEPEFMLLVIEKLERKPKLSGGYVNWAIANEQFLKWELIEHMRRKGRKPKVATQANSGTDDFASKIEASRARRTT